MRIKALFLGAVTVSAFAFAESFDSCDCSVCRTTNNTVQEVPPCDVCRQACPCEGCLEGNQCDLCQQGHSCDPCQAVPCVSCEQKDPVYAVQEQQCEECVPCEEEPVCTVEEAAPCEEEPVYAVQEEQCEECVPCEEEPVCTVEEAAPCEEEPVYAVQEEQCEECVPCEEEPVCTVEEAAPCEEEPVYAVQEEQPVAAPATVSKKEETDCCKSREPRPCCTPVNPCPMKMGIDDEIYLAFDFLFWRAENHGYSYAFNRTVDSFSQGKVMRVTPNWDPGFRLGLGWNTTYDHWDILAVWTWYHNHSKASHNNPTASGNTGYYPQWPVANDNVLGPYQNVTADYSLHYDTGDLEFGRGFYATKSLAIRPHFGVRGMWIYQKMLNQLFVPVNTTLTADQSREFTGVNRGWGVGPRIGANGEWHMDYGFSFLGKGSTTLAYGKTNVLHNTQTWITGRSGYNTEADYSESFWQLSPSLQLQFGVQWEHYFKRHDKFFKLGLSWEANYWWNQFQVPVAFQNDLAPMPSVGNQPVTLEGITFDVELDF